MKTFNQYMAGWLAVASLGIAPGSGWAQFFPASPTGVAAPYAPATGLPPSAPATGPAPAGAQPPGASPSVGLAAAAQPPQSTLAVMPTPALSSPPVSSLAAPTAISASEEVGEEEPLTDTDLICVVGSEHILAGDMRLIYEPHIEEYLGRITPSQEKMLRQRYTREALKGYVGIKALYLEFFRENTGTAAPSERKETQKTILTKANKIFFEEQVPRLLKKHKVSDLKALEEKMRTQSASIRQVRQQFVEQVLASEVERRHVPQEVVIDREELLKYYEEHAKDWDKPGRARWRQITVRFDRFPSREIAKETIEAMGNEMLFGGKPFEALAKERSQGFTADKGGVYDWTTQGALKSTQLDEAIFSIPPRRLSKVIEDDIGFHIIEVLEREDATTLSFEAAQDEMRKAITETKIKDLRDAYHKEVMARTVIWTRWPDDIPGSRSLTEVLEDSPLTLADPAQ